MPKNILTSLLAKAAPIVVGLVLFCSPSYAAKTYPLCTKSEVLVRVTFYYPNEAGSGYRGSTGVKLKPWQHCAVDPKYIPYGRKVHIPGIGTLASVDTGSALKSKKAAKAWGKTVTVVDVCVRDRKEMDRMAREFPKFVKVRIST